MPTGGQLGKRMCSAQLKWVSRGYRSWTHAPLIVNTAPRTATTSPQQSLAAALKMADCFLSRKLKRKSTACHQKKPYLDYSHYIRFGLNYGSICIMAIDSSVRSPPHTNGNTETWLLNITVQSRNKGMNGWSIWLAEGGSCSVVDVK